MTGHGHAAHVAEIKALLEERAAATRAKDIDAATAHYAHDVVTFDVVPPLLQVGIDGVRERSAAWFASFNGPIGYELHEVRAAADEQVAFASCVYKVTGSTTTGEEIGMWVRASFGFHRIDGEWKITHEHDSVPMDPATGLSVTDAAP